MPGGRNEGMGVRHGMREGLSEGHYQGRAISNGPTFASCIRGLSSWDPSPSLPCLAGEGPRWLGIRDRCWVKGGPLRRGQGCLGSVALLFAFKQSETGTLSPLRPPTPGRVWEVGEQGGEQEEGPGSPFSLQSQKDCSAPSYQPVSQPSKVAQGPASRSKL